jgi:hypothetical protein
MINEEGLRNWFGKSKSKDGKKGWVNVVTGDSCASDKPGEGVPKCVSSAKRSSMSKSERKAAQSAKRREDPGQQSKSGAAAPTMVKTDRKTRKEEMEVNEAADKKGKGSGTKDACYHKVKSRYSVWPSAYASGALVKCRKKGAKNWGNSSKNEEFLALPEFTEVQIKAMESNGIEVEVVEACWDGYEKKGMKTMFGKRYPNCVKKTKAKTKKEEVELDEKCWDSHKQVGMKKKGGKMVPNCVPKNEETQSEKDRILERLTLGEGIERIPSESGKVYLVSFLWRGKYMMMKLFFPELKQPNKRQVQAAMDKVYPGSKVMRFDASMLDNKDTYIRVPDMSEETEVTEAVKGQDTEMRKAASVERKSGEKRLAPSKGKGYADQQKQSINYMDKKTKNNKIIVGMTHEETEVAEGAAWTKKSGKNKEGGLNEKGRKSYERENPGSDLKAPSKKKGNKRRASFCARMKGMKKKLTSAKTANDPDSRINKSLRAWNC